jgi:hypothetical protein
VSTILILNENGWTTPCGNGPNKADCYNRSLKNLIGSFGSENAHQLGIEAAKLICYIPNVATPFLAVIRTIDGAWRSISLEKVLRLRLSLAHRKTNGRASKTAAFWRRVAF